MRFPQKHQNTPGKFQNTQNHSTQFHHMQESAKILPHSNFHLRNQLFLPSRTQTDADTIKRMQFGLPHISPVHKIMRIRRATNHNVKIFLNFLHRSQQKGSFYCVSVEKSAKFEIFTTFAVTSHELGNGTVQLCRKVLRDA